VVAVLLGRLFHRFLLAAADNVRRLRSSAVVIVSLRYKPRRVWSVCLLRSYGMLTAEKINTFSCNSIWLRHD
jgi:hypothetical protein